jgi:hypothetical protein
MAIIVGLGSTLFVYQRSRNISLKGEAYVVFLAALFTGLITGVGAMLTFLPITSVLNASGLPIAISAYLGIDFARLGLIMVVLGIILMVIQVLYSMEIARKMSCGNQ